MKMARESLAKQIETDPVLAELVEEIIGAEPGTVRVKKASVVLLRVDPPQARGVLQFNVWPAFLKA